MKKYTFLIFTLGCMLSFNVFCAIVDFIKITDASYFLSNANFAVNFKVYYGNTQHQIEMPRTYCSRRQHRQVSSQYFYFSGNDIYNEILKKINPDNTSTEIEVEAIGQGEGIKIKKDNYYNVRFLYTKTLFVKEKNNE